MPFSPTRTTIYCLPRKMKFYGEKMMNAQITSIVESDSSTERPGRCLGALTAETVTVEVDGNSLKI